LNALNAPDFRMTAAEPLSQPKRWNGEKSTIPKF
jgi:hypothetical protein